MSFRNIQSILGILLLFFVSTVSATEWQQPSDTLPNQRERELLGNGPVCGDRAKRCQGHREWADGSIYEGEFSYGKPNGLGVYIWVNGDRYTGKWKGGTQEGYGIMKFYNGDKYDGDWKGGKKHGQGNMLWADSMSYRGEWASDQMEGFGKLVMPNGESYEGEWKSGVVHGDGTKIEDDGSKFVGKYKSGDRNGSGVVTYATGDILIGKWKNGHMHKTGTFEFSNGATLNSSWNEGEMEKSTYTTPSGKVIEGHPEVIGEHMEKDEDLMESEGSNIGLTWYAIGVEYMKRERPNEARDAFNNARKFVSPSSEINKMIYGQMKKLPEPELVEGT